MITDEFRKLCFRESTKLSKDEISHLKNYINTIFVPYIENIKKQNPDIDENGVIELIIKKTEEMNIQQKALMEKTLSTFYIYSAINYLVLHPEVFKKINDSISSKETKSINTTLNTALNKLQLNQLDFNYILKFLILSNKEKTSKCQQNIKDAICLLPIEYEKLLNNENLSKEARLRKADEYIRKFFPYSDLKKINETHRIYLYGEYEHLKVLRDEISENLHDDFINSIILIAKDLQSLNLFSKYHSNNYSNLSKIGFGDYANSTLKTDLTNPETLKDLSLNDLIVLNLFWINRYAKETENFANGIFTIITNKQLSNILAGNFDSQYLNTDILTGTLLKYRVLKQHMDSNFELSQKDLYKTFCSTYLKTSYSDYFKNIHALHNADNDLSRNFQLFFPFADISKNLYKNKNYLQNLTIFNLEDIQMFQNVGIIPNQISEDGYHVTIDTKLPCLGFDANLTFPVRTHIKMSTLQDYLNCLNLRNTFIRVYEGYRDFTYPDSNHTPITAQLVLPFSKESSNFINKFTKSMLSGKTNPQNMDLILHLNWLKRPSAIPQKYKTNYRTESRTKKIKFGSKVYRCIYVILWLPFTNLY